MQATPDDPKKMTIAFRRDSFCGKMSACNNLRNTAFLIRSPRCTRSARFDGFAKDLQWFAAVCRIVHGFRICVSARLARGLPLLIRFATARSCWKPTEFRLRRSIYRKSSDASVDERYDDAAKRSSASIKKYVNTKDVPASALMKMAKLGGVIDEWMSEGGSANQRGAVLDVAGRTFRGGTLHRDEHDERKLLPRACEVDIAGTLRMHALALASGTPCALLDWNNNYGTILTKQCVSTAPTSRSIFSVVKWIFRPSSPEPLERKIHMAPGWCEGQVR